MEFKLPRAEVGLSAMESAQILRCAAVSMVGADRHLHIVVAVLAEVGISATVSALILHCAAVSMVGADRHLHIVVAVLAEVGISATVSALILHCAAVSMVGADRQLSTVAEILLRQLQQLLRCHLRLQPIQLLQHLSFQLATMTTIA